MPLSRISRKGSTGFLALAAAGVLGMIATSSSAQVAAVDAAKPKQVMRVPVAGVQVAIDPATGRLRQPTRAEAQALAAGLAKIASTSIYKEQVSLSDDGVLSIDLRGAFLDFAAVHLNADGSLTEGCFESQAAVTEFLSSGAVGEEK
jgi:hypothetical protein